MKKTTLSKLLTTFLLLGILAIGTIGCGIKTDKDIMSAIDSSVKNCKVEKKYALVSNCKNNQFKNLKKMIEKKSLPKALPSLAVAMNNPDESTQCVACKAMNDIYNRWSDSMKMFNNNPKLIEKKVAKKLLEGLKKSSKPAMKYCATTVARAVTLVGGMDKELLNVIDNHPNKDVRRYAYSSGFVYASVRLFPQLVAYFNKDKKNRSTIVSAFRNVNGNGGKYNDEQKKVICPWAQKYINDEDDFVARYAAYILAGKCRGKYIDIALDAAEKLQKDGKLDRWYVYDAAPFSCGKGFLRSKHVTEKQCERRKALRIAAGIDKKKK